MRLHDAHVLVTGASRGIGLTIAERAAARGARVTLVARESEALRGAAAQVGGQALPVDLADVAQREALVARAEALNGPVDVLVNAAGLDLVRSLFELSAQEVTALFQVNLLAPAELCRQVLPGMLERGRGHLVNVSSGFSTIMAPGLTPYCASKAGLSHLTAGLRAELAGTAIGTTLVELGPVKTRMYDDILRDRLAGPALVRVVRLHVARELEPREVAGAVLDAVEQGRLHVVLPRRMRPVTALTHLPRSAARLVFAGLPKR